MRTAQLLRYIRPMSFNTLKAGRHGEKNAPILGKHTHKGSWFHQLLSLCCIGAGQAIKGELQPLFHMCSAKVTQTDYLSVQMYLVVCIIIIIHLYCKVLCFLFVCYMILLQYLFLALHMINFPFEMIRTTEGTKCPFEKFIVQSI